MGQLLYSSFSSSRRSVTLPSFSISNSLIKSSLTLETLYMYCSIERRVTAAALLCVMFHQALPTVEYILTGDVTSGRLV